MVPICAPTVLPVRSASLLMVVSSARTTMAWLASKYGSEKSYVFLRSSVMVTEDRMASYWPAFQAGEDAVPGGVLDLDVEPLILGDGRDQVDVEADDVLALVHEFHGRERGVAGDDELLGRGRRR